MLKLHAKLIHRGQIWDKTHALGHGIFVVFQGVQTYFPLYPGHSSLGGMSCISRVPRCCMISRELIGTHLGMQLLSKWFCNYTDNGGSVKIEKCFVDRYMENQIPNCNDFKIIQWEKKAICIYY